MFVKSSVMLLCLRALPAHVGTEDTEALDNGGARVGITASILLLREAA